MKFNDLSKEQQQLFTAWMNGETMQYKNAVSGEWFDIKENTIFLLFDRELRVKPKEPVVELSYSAIFNDGAQSFVSSLVSSVTPELTG